MSLLIIEDNRDVQQYLITLLESKYTFTSPVMAKKA